MNTCGSAALVAVLALPAATGCGQIRYRTPADVDDTVLHTARETQVDGAGEARVDQSGTRVEVIADHTCSVHEVREVNRVIKHRLYDANARGTRNLGIAGGALLATGGVLVSMPFWPVRTPHTAELASGIGLGTLGFVLAVAAIQDAVRARMVDEERRRMMIDGGVITAHVPCGYLAHAAGREAVVGRVVGRDETAIPLGHTDARGRLLYDLTDLPGAVMVNLPEPKQMTLFLRDAPIGSVSLREAERVDEERAWIGAAICREAREPTPCVPIDEYLRRHPEGPHAAEARAYQDRVEVSRRALAEAQRQEEARRAAEEAKRAAEEAKRAAEEAKRAALIDAAAVAARRAASVQCKLTCQAQCRGDTACVGACTLRSCD